MIYLAATTESHTTVYAFVTKEDRDRYVDGNHNRLAIAKREIGRWVDAPRAFSGMARCLVPNHVQRYPGCCGTIQVWYDGDNGAQRLSDLIVCK
jgi:hypothetical protein